MSQIDDDGQQRVVVLGTSAPNRFRTTSTVLSFLSKQRLIRAFEVEQCSVHSDGSIVIRFGTRLAAQLLALRLHLSSSSARYFQMLSGPELAVSQYIVLNLCVQRRSRDGNKFGHILRRWRGEGIIDCDADRRQFYLFLFKDGDKKGNDSYIKLTLDDRILERIYILNNDYSAGIQFAVSEPPRCDIHRDPILLPFDEKAREREPPQRDSEQKSSEPVASGPICPKILLTGSCTNKSCTFRHDIQADDAEHDELGNAETFWTRTTANDADDKRMLHRRDRQQGAWKEAAYYSFKQQTATRYVLDKSSDELDPVGNSAFAPWTFEVDSSCNDQDSLNSLLKFLGQCWLFCVEFVRMKEVPERYVNAIRQMRGIDPANIESMATDRESRYPVPAVFGGDPADGAKAYYHPPFEYRQSSRSAELRLKRHLHDLNHLGAHDVAFAMDACLHNFPPVFIPEDLVDWDKEESGADSRVDPDIFFKCLFQEIKSELSHHGSGSNSNSNGNDNGNGSGNGNGNGNGGGGGDDDTFTNLMNQMNHHHHQQYQNRHRNRRRNGAAQEKSLDAVDMVWQALMHCAKNEEYRGDRSVITDDVETTNSSAKQKQNVLPALELFYKSLDWAGSNGRKLKQKVHGNTHADHVWIKRVSVTPVALWLDICEEESTRMFRFKQYSPPTDFCRVEFMDQHTNRSMAKAHFQIGTVGRYRSYKVLQNGLSVAGITYKFLFFGNKQVRDAKVWMKAELIRGFDANRVRADIARLSTERNIGKKMDRFHLFMSKGTPGSIYGENEIEIIEDQRARDGKMLTDGCSLILEEEIKRSFPEYVASMLVRIGGAKTQMMSASKELLEQLVVSDIAQRKKSGVSDGSASSTARNLSPKVVLNRSCLKFMTDTQKQLEIKKCCRALPCMMNREFLNHCLFHKLCGLQPEAIDIVNSAPHYDFDAAQSFKLSGSNKQILLQLFSKYQRAFSGQLNKMEDICNHQLEKLRELKSRFGARAIYIRPATQEEQKYFFDALLFLSSRLKVEEPFLNRLTDQVTSSHSDCGKRLNFKDIADLTAILKRMWGGLKSKFKIQLPWPSCRMAGIADFQYKLKENEVFLKIKIPTYFDWNCVKCGKTSIKYWHDTCDAPRCGADHPIYYVHRGPVGLMKNPCLHPGSYRLFEGVFHQELDDMFDGEVLVFSASAEHCSTSQVHLLSGGDLDGDDFLCVVQRDLLPLPNDTIRCMEYDSEPPRETNGYVDISMCVEYWLKYQINDCVGIIAELHESFSDCELGVGSPRCLELAKSHSAAVDYAKTGVAAEIPRGVGIPLPISDVKYPHHMGKHQAISYKSTSIKGILYNSVRIPSKLWRDREFRRMYNLKNNHVTYCPNPYHGGGSSNNGSRAAAADDHMSYQREGPKKPQMTNRERLRERLHRGCEICGIASFDNAHFMNQHKDDPLHRRNKQMARDKAMLQRIFEAKAKAPYKSNIGAVAAPQPAPIAAATASSAASGASAGTALHRQRRALSNHQHHHHPLSGHQHRHQHSLQNLPPHRNLSSGASNSSKAKGVKRGGRFSDHLAANEQRSGSMRSRKGGDPVAAANSPPNIVQHYNTTTNIIVNHQNEQKKHHKVQQQRGVKRHEQWAVGDRVRYKKGTECLITDILYDSYPPRALIQRVSDQQTLCTDFSKLEGVSGGNDENDEIGGQRLRANKPVVTVRDRQIQEAKDAAIGLGFGRNRVEKEMHLFLEVLKVSGHSLNPTCFLNYLCEATQSERHKNK